MGHDRTEGSAKQDADSCVHVDDHARPAFRYPFEDLQRLTSKDEHEQGPAPPRKRACLTPPRPLNASQDLALRPSTPSHGATEQLLFSDGSSGRSASPLPSPERRPPPPQSPQTGKAPRFKLGQTRPKTPGSPSSHVPRFRLHPQTLAQSPSLPKRPNFILPHPDDGQDLSNEPGGLVNEALVSLLLSPRKKGQRYVPGGMATTVRDWVLELANSTPTAANLASKRSNAAIEPTVATLAVRIATVDPRRGWNLVQGEHLDSTADGETGERGEQNWILLGQGNAPGFNAATRRSGSHSWQPIRAEAVVNVLHPVWDVQIGGRQWHVGSRWEANDKG